MLCVCVYWREYKTAALFFFLYKDSTQYTKKSTTQGRIIAIRSVIVYIMKKKGIWKLKKKISFSQKVPEHFVIVYPSISATAGLLFVLMNIIDAQLKRAYTIIIIIHIRIIDIIVMTENISVLMGSE